MVLLNYLMLLSATYLSTRNSNLAYDLDYLVDLVARQAVLDGLSDQI